MAARDRAPKSIRVLVVEDDADAQTIYSETLAHEGFDVDQARSLMEARDHVRTRAPDVVVLDCRLPDGDGLELAKEWLGDPIMKDVPVIVLTAFSARQDVEAALLAGADAFVVKPCAGNVLAKHIERVLTGSRPSHTRRK